MNINNPKNVKGMGGILTDDDEDIDIDDIEKSVINGIVIKKKDDKPVDLAKEYSKEIEDLGKKFNIGGGKPSSISATINGDEHDETDDRGIDELLNWAPYNKPVIQNTVPQKQIVSGNSSSGSGSTYKSPYNLVDDNDEDEDEDNTPAQAYYPSSNSIPKSWSSSNPDDSQLNRMTNEELKQSRVSEVLSNIEKNNDDAEFIQQEDEGDEMARIMEQIDLLRGNLENENIDLTRIPEVNSGTSKKEAKAVLRILQIKNDRLRYCDFFEEGILAVAYGLEGVFNGNREILGSKIDLTGYSDTVKVKLRRMRYDTSNFVSGIMQGYNISSGWRIVLELIPSLFLYSRNRRLKANDNLISDENYQKAIQDLPA
jgi:hypothetical protein